MWVPPSTLSWPPGPQLTRQLKWGPSSLEGERHRGMSGCLQPPEARRGWGAVGERRLQL